MRTRIKLPKYLTLKSLIVSMGVCHQLFDAEDQIILDANDLVFADPFGITLLGIGLHDAHEKRKFR